MINTKQAYDDGADKLRSIVMKVVDKTAGLKRHSEEVNKVVRESLRGALTLLMKETPYEKITISAICQKAGVSRMAFYGNYEGKEQLFDSILEDLTNRIYAKVGNPFLVQTGINWYKNFFRLLFEENDILSLIFDAGFRKKYFIFVNDIILNDETLSSAEKYRHLIWSGGIENVILYWLGNGLKESPDELADFCNDHLKI